MGTIKVVFSVSLGHWEEEASAEFRADITDEEINEHFLDWREDYIDGGWEKEMTD